MARSTKTRACSKQLAWDHRTCSFSALRVRRILQRVLSVGQFVIASITSFRAFGLTFRKPHNMCFCADWRSHMALRFRKMSMMPYSRPGRINAAYNCMLTQTGKFLNRAPACFSRSATLIALLARAFACFFSSTPRQLTSMPR